MNSIRTAAVLVILAVIVTGISMANKPNDEDGINITVSPSTLVLSRDIGCVSVHSNITESMMTGANVDLALLRLSGPVGGFVEPYDMFLDNRGHLVFKFIADEVKEIVEVDRQVELSLVSVTIEEDETEIFDSLIASDTIRVKE